VSAERESPFFRGWAEWVLRLRWLVLLVAFGITAFFAMQMKQHLRFDSSVEYFAAGSEARELLEEFQEDFGNDTWQVVLVRGDVFSVEFLDRLRGLHDSLEGFQFGAAPADPAAPSGAPAPADDGWGGGSDDVGFGSPSSPSPAPSGEAAGDGWGGGSDDVGFGSPSSAPSSAASSGAEEGGQEAAPQGDTVEEVVSLINVRRTLFEGGAVRVRGLLDGGTPSAAALPALREEVLGDDTLVGFVVGEDGRHAALMMRTRALDFESRAATYRALRQAVKSHDAEGFRVSVTGLPAMNAELVTTMQADMRRLIAAAGVVMATVLAVLFRHAIGVIAPLIVVAMAAIWTLGLMAMTGTPVTLLTNIVPAFLACVGLGDSIHVMAVYRDNRSRGAPHRESIISAVGSTGMPILFTTLTTAVGLLSFQFAKMDAIAEMGAFAAFGVCTALLHSVTFLPIALSFLRGEGLGGQPAAADGDRERDWIDRLLGFATGLSRPGRGSAPVLIGGLLVVATAAVGISRITVYHNPVDWLPVDYPARVELDRLDAHIGGTAQVNVVIDAPGERGLRDLELLRGLEKLDAHIRAFEHPTTGERIVTGTSSLLDVLRETNRALRGGEPAAYALPDTQRGVSDTLLLFESAAPRDLLRLTTADLSRSHITVRLRWMDATSYKPFTAWIQQGIDEHIGDKAQVRPTGSVYELVTTVGGLIGDLVRSFGAALVSVTLMMVLLLRSPTLGLISMIPNLVPVALVMGFMGFAAIPLDLTNLLIASIVIGVAVDNTVHYVFQWRSAWRTGAGVEGGIRHALEHAGRALVGTGMILALGFGVYLSSSMINIQRFGMLVGSACVFALFTNLIFAPALLRLFFGRTETPKET